MFLTFPFLARVGTKNGFFLRKIIGRPELGETGGIVPNYFWSEKLAPTGDMDENWIPAGNVIASDIKELIDNPGWLINNEGELYEYHPPKTRKRR